jgi:C1A family cysteine protease
MRQAPRIAALLISVGLILGTPFAASADDNETPSPTPEATTSVPEVTTPVAEEEVELTEADLAEIEAAEGESGVPAEVPVDPAEAAASPEVQVTEVVSQPTHATQLEIEKEAYEDNTKWPTGALRSTLNTDAINDGVYTDTLGQPVRAADAAGTFDLRNTHPTWTTPVRDQDPWGTCWSFASAASAESSLARKNVATNPYLSASHLVWSSYDSGGYWANLTVDPTTDDLGNCLNADCKDSPLQKGGTAYVAAATWSRYLGVQTEANYPYSAATTRLSQARLSTSVYHMKNMYALPAPRTSSGSFSNANLTTIKNFLQKYGAIYLTYAARTNNLNMANWAWYNPPGTAWGNGHAVTIVGYNDHYAASNFKTAPPGNGAFLIKNSWGTSRGVNGCDSNVANGMVNCPEGATGGYFWMSYYDYTIKDLAYFDVGGTSTGVNSDGLTKVYSHDPMGMQSALQDGSKSVYMANVFTASRTEFLRAVSITANAPNVKYKVQVLLIPKGKGIKYGKAAKIKGKATSISGTFTYAGYKTVTLPTMVYLKKGQKFAVVVYESKSSTVGWPIEVDTFTTKDRSTIGKGQSYYSHNGKTWTDLATAAKSISYCLAYSCGNFAIKAMTGTITAKLDGKQKVTYLKGQPINKSVGTMRMYFNGKLIKSVKLSSKDITITGFNKNKSGTARVTYKPWGKSVGLKYTVVMAKIVLDARGGTYTAAKVPTFSYKGKLPALPTPKKLGYSFLGWYTKAVGGTKYPGAGKKTPWSRSVRLYAHWKARTFTVAFDNQGGVAGKPKTVKVTFNKTWPKLPTPKKTGSTFAGWYTKRMSAGTCQGTQIKAGQKVATAQTRLYACWTTP